MQVGIIIITGEHMREREREGEIIEGREGRGEREREERKTQLQFTIALCSMDLLRGCMETRGSLALTHIHNKKS